MFMSMVACRQTRDRASKQHHSIVTVAMPRIQRLIALTANQRVDKKLVKLVIELL